MEASAFIRRSHPTWVQDRVWLDDEYLAFVIRGVGGASRFRRHGDAALSLLKQALIKAARHYPRSPRGFRSVVEESQYVQSVLTARLGGNPPRARYAIRPLGTPSIYFECIGRLGQSIVIRISDHPPDNRIDETLIDISPTGHSAFSDWFLQRLDELGVGE